MEEKYPRYCTRAASGGGGKNRRGGFSAAGYYFGRELHRWEDVDYTDDLDEVAALMCALDLVISAGADARIEAAGTDTVREWALSRVRDRDGNADGHIDADHQPLTGAG